MDISAGTAGSLPTKKHKSLCFCRKQHLKHAASTVKGKEKQASSILETLSSHTSSDALVLQLRVPHTPQRNQQFHLSLLHTFFRHISRGQRTVQRIIHTSNTLLQETPEKRTRACTRAHMDTKKRLHRAGCLSSRTERSGVERRRPYFHSCVRRQDPSQQLTDTSRHV